MEFRVNGDGTTSVRGFECPRCKKSFGELSGTIETNTPIEINGVKKYKTTVTFDEDSRAIITLHGQLMHDNE